MDPSKTDIQTLKDKLTEYKHTIENGGSLHPKNDALELDVNGGSIWLHPKDDGTTVDIHFIKDDPDAPTHGSGQLTAHLTRKVGFPVHGKYEPYTPFFSNDRETHRVNYEYFTQD